MSTREIKEGDWVVRKKGVFTPGWIKIQKKYAVEGLVFPSRFKVHYIVGEDVMFMGFNGVWTLANFELAPTKKPKKYL